MSSEALAKPIITRNSSEFKLDAYASIPAGELVVFAIQVLQADTAPVAVEEIVSTCFRFFPHSFALRNYFYWPDSALVARRLHDSKEKGLLKGNTADGFETKVQGRQVAKHVAKALGVSLPMPPKVEVPVAPEVETPKVEEVIVDKNPSSSLMASEEEKKETVPSTPIVKAVKKRETRKKEVQQKAVKSEKKPALKKQVVQPKKEVTAPVKKKPAPKPKKTVRPMVTAVKKPVVKVEKKEERKKKEVRPTPTVKKEPVKAAPKPKVEKTVAKKQVTLRLRAGQASKKVKVVQPTLKPEIKKVGTKVEKKQATKKKEAKASAQPTQLTLGLTPPSAWKKAEVPATKPKLKEDASPVHVKVLAPVAASKEEKEKAAKVIKQLERSDAYQLYRRNGKRASIGEFDFRNMLFATMESSAETLKRNVELFKRYAGIHFRTDLVAFLEFCEEHFAELLRSKVKKPLRK